MEEGELLEEGELSEVEAAGPIDTEEPRQASARQDVDRSIEPPFKRRRRFEEEPGASPSASFDIISPARSLGRNGVEAAHASAAHDDIIRASPAAQQELQRRREVHSELVTLYKAYSRVKQGAARCNGQKGGRLGKEAEAALKAVADATKGREFAERLR